MQMLAIKGSQFNEIANQCYGKTLILENKYNQKFDGKAKKGSVFTQELLYVPNTSMAPQPSCWELNGVPSKPAELSWAGELFAESY